ncbi:MAG: hypothetical protein R3D45_00540 [Rhizobiaceae bacterium]
MKSGWRPERRNRKIGTASAGFKKRNRLTIPRQGEVEYFEDVKPNRVEEWRLSGLPLFCIYENPRPGCTYGCSPEDVHHLLSHLPQDDLSALEMIVFRQPTRKQSTLNPVWGRLIYVAQIAGHTGSAIILEAVDLETKHTWPRRRDAEDARELERLRGDGHSVEAGKREFAVTFNEDSVRNTILYRTLLHEIGHWVQYARAVLSKPDHLLEGAYDFHFARPVSERDLFAHSYAGQMAAKLRNQGVIPFEPIVERKTAGRNDGTKD